VEVQEEYKKGAREGTRGRSGGGGTFLVMGPPERVLRMYN
jgi:hypothetical protein